VVKQVAGGFADPNDEFDFTVDSLTQGKDYEFQRYTSTDGSAWDAETGTGASGGLHANAEGEIIFKLKHNEKIVLVLPGVTSVNVAEAESDYTPSYAINNGEIQPYSNPVFIPMNNNDMTITFTNTKGQIAPTGYSSYLWPLIWMMLLGMFLWTAMTYMRKRRSLDGYAMEAAGVDAYDGVDTYEDAYVDHDVAGINADTDFAVNETSEEGVTEVRSETSETSYEAFDWTRITI